MLNAGLLLDMRVQYVMSHLTLDKYDDTQVTHKHDLSKIKHTCIHSNRDTHIQRDQESSTRYTVSIYIQLIDYLFIHYLFIYLFYSNTLRVGEIQVNIQLIWLPIQNMGTLCFVSLRISQKRSKDPSCGVWGSNCFDKFVNEIIL